MKITFNSPVILTFSILCAIVYVLNHTLGIMVDSFKLLPEWNFSSFMWYVRLFSNTLGHGGSDHLMGNLAFILLLGPIAEEKYGSKNILIMLLTTAFVSSIVHLIFSNNALLGASGIVFMLILIASLVNFKDGEIPLTFILVVLIYIGKEVMGFFADDNISHTTHIVGGIVGAIFGFMMGGSNKNSKKPIGKAVNPLQKM